VKRICLILIFGLPMFAKLGLAQAAVKPRAVICQGVVEARQLNNRVFDRGQTQMSFYLTDSSTIKSIRVATRFSKLKPQEAEAFESLASKRAVATGKFRADFFNIGNNGACQIGLGYQGDLANSKAPATSWGLFVMGCGTYGVTGNLKCQIK
jgi:hypothetical protein